MGGAEHSFWMADHFFSGVARQWADLGPWSVGGGAAGGLTTAGWIALVVVSALVLASLAVVLAWLARPMLARVPAHHRSGAGAARAVQPRR